VHQLLKRHWARLDRGRISVQALDLAGAVIRQVMSLQPGRRVILNLMDSPPPDLLDDGDQEPLPDPAAPETFRALVAEVNGLARYAPLYMQEKLRFLLGSMTRFASTLESAAPEPLEEILTEINLLTSNRGSQSLMREIALLARDVYDSIKAMSDGLPVEALTESTEGASEAVRKLNGVMQKLEQVAGENLDILEHMTRKVEGDHEPVAGIITGLKAAQQRLAELAVSHPARAEELERVKRKLSDEAGAVAMHMRARHAASSERLLSLMSHQGFQDHTGATLKRIVQFVEQLQNQIVALLSKYKSVIELSMGTPDLSETPAQAETRRQSQDDVDKLLAGFGV
jgi:chemotaxis regulatin CheY-phosphate phosphatase CheZ